MAEAFKRGDKPKTVVLELTRDEARDLMTATGVISGDLHKSAFDIHDALEAAGVKWTFSQAAIVPIYRRAA